MVHERATGVGGAVKPSDTLFINGEDVSKYGVLVESFTVSGTTITNAEYQGVGRTHFNLLRQFYGQRTITLSLFYRAESRHDLTLTKSKVDSLLLGKCELFLPDGFYYTAVLDTAGELSILGREGAEVIGLCKYTLHGIQHEDMVTVLGNEVYCESTIPHTDCRLSCTASQDYVALPVGSVIITDVAEGDEIVVDGILGRILQNGAPCAGNMSFIHLPSLVPGENYFQCPEDLTVEYYPTFV